MSYANVRTTETLNRKRDVLWLLQKKKKKKYAAYLVKEIAKHMQITFFKAWKHGEISTNYALEDRWPVNPHSHHTVEMGKTGQHVCQLPWPLPSLF